MTETASSTTCRYETQISNDFGDPVIADGAPEGWSVAAIEQRDSGLGAAIPALLSTLESHALVRREDRLATWGGMMTPQVYNVTDAGRALLKRLVRKGS